MKFADDIYRYVYRLSVEASDHLMEKQMATYFLLVDTAEEKGGNGSCCLQYLLCLLVEIFCFNECQIILLHKGNARDI